MGDSWMHMFRLPEIQEELYKVLQQTESDFAKLPQPPSNNPLGDILQALDNFKKEVAERVEGTPEADGLLQTIRPHTIDFKSKIRETAPNFVPWERSEAHKHALPQTSFFSGDEEGDDRDRDREYHYPAGTATRSSPISKWDAGSEREDGPFIAPRIADGPRIAAMSDYVPRAVPARLSESDYTPGVALA